MKGKILVHRFARGPISVYLLPKRPPKSRYLSWATTQTRHKICHHEGTHPWGQTRGIGMVGRIRGALQHNRRFLP
ncbi:hypothetical protein F01_520033 [Burkholderia cenocepacia]|nr:hypothetical protein F01_520033 [Burkholderia cenocepacia]